MNTHLVDGLSLNSHILNQLIEDLPKNRIDFRPRAGIWTVREHLIHLVETQEMLLSRIELFVQEEHPVITPFVPGAEISPQDTSPSPSDLVQSFADYRLRQLQAVNNAPPDAWKRTALHPEYLNYSFLILVRHILLHDYFHMHRIEELGFLNPEYITDL